MKCLILAAGTSTRLRPQSNDLPKCLLTVGGIPILRSILDNVLAAGSRQIAIVIGYKADAIRSFVKEAFPQTRIRFILNPNYETTNNAYSLLLGRAFLKNDQEERKSKESVLLLDSDIVFSAKLLPFLLDSKAENRIAVRVSGEHDEEEIRVTVDRERNITRIGKEIPLSQTYGESVGIEIFSYELTKMLFDVLERRVREGTGRTEFYEQSFQELIDSGIEMEAVDVSEFPVVEIDTMEDVRAAEHLFGTGRS